MAMSEAADERGATSSAPEDLFTDLFVQVCGPERAGLLAPQHPVTDIYGRSRYVDLALRARGEKIAFEIDGLPWHVPDVVPAEKYEDDLLRQNSLIHQGWRVFRWTDRQVAHEPERVKEQLALFLERVPQILAFDDFLPRQAGEVVQLRAHQDDALLALQRMRDEGKTIALLEHATGAGKTVTAITDARRLGGRTLWLVHRRDLVAQTQREFQRLWPEAVTGRYYGGAHEAEADNLVAAIQSVADHLDEFGSGEFSYLVIDEAHHAAAETYRRILEYFHPQFTLGLTATAERADGQDLLQLFRDCAHRLTLPEAVGRGELVPIRCVRVQTNVDLSKVRYNQVQYNRRDIEETIAIPARDRLIVQTYQDHVPGRKAVVFAVNVRHGEGLAEEFRRSRVPAQSVSGRMPNRERDQCLQAFHEGRLRVLCACDILNEGWDCPDLEVLLMARPTLSRVVYLQQLGRGTRKAPGKECLVVFDFVDNAGRYNQAVSVHRVLGVNRYLLPLGGSGVIWHPPGPIAALILARGEPFPQRVRMRRGEPSRCHANAAALWAGATDTYRLVTGYALSDDHWWSHSWVVDETHLYETTHRFERYFGAVLPPLLALKFWWENVLLDRYPDGEEPPEYWEDHPGVWALTAQVAESPEEFKRLTRAYFKGRCA
jgi:superfamily II DNA or RNA helicase